MILRKNILLKTIEIWKHARTAVALSYLIGCRSIWKCAMLKSHSKRSVRNKTPLQWKLSYQLRREHRSRHSQLKSYGNSRSIRLRTSMMHIILQGRGVSDQKPASDKEDKRWMSSLRRRKSPARRERSQCISQRITSSQSMTRPPRIQMSIWNSTPWERISEAHKTCYQRIKYSAPAMSWITICPRPQQLLRILKNRRILSGGRNARYSSRPCRFQER